jgi:tRNA-dependent cyclodipeptide synthase
MTHALAVRYNSSTELQHCRICVSVGSPYFEGSCFSSIIDWLNSQSSLREVVIVLADTLQRHNYGEAAVLGLAREQQAIEAGDAWLERNGPKLKNLSMKFSVFRWNDIRLSPQFEPLQQQINDLYASDNKFRAAIDEDVSSYLKRLARKKVLADDAAHISRNYFLEELCCITIMIERFPFPEAYPGNFLKSAMYLASMPDPGIFAPMSSHRFIEIKIKKGVVGLLHNSPGLSSEMDNPKVDKNIE